jgi:general secretion pathway protein K
MNGTIRDEAGKFPINELVDDSGEYQPAYRKILARLLAQEPFGLGPMEVDQVLQPLKDWMDPDDLPSGEFGAEKAFYAEQGAVKTCPNGPLRALGELRFVKGIGSSLYAGKEDKPGLRDLCTVHSEGTININTASREILAAMVQEGLGPDTARDFAADAVRFRREEQHFDFLGETDWYRNRLAGYNDVQLPAHVAGVQSDVFSVRLKARTGAKTTSLFCVLRREREDKKIRVRAVYKDLL